MFTYEKDMSDIVYQIKTDNDMFLFLDQQAHRQEMILGEWCLMISSQLGNEKYANLMLELGARWFTMVEQLGIAMRRLQGNTAYMIDVIDCENPDVTEIKTSSAQMVLEKEEKVEHYPDDFCGAILACRKKCKARLELFTQALDHTEDAAMSQFLKHLMDEIMDIANQYQNILCSMEDDGTRTFSDNYENERSWAIDNGNYIDPKVPLFDDFTKQK